MAFVPKSQPQHYAEMEAHLKATTGLTDFARGSNIRGVLEAASIQDAELSFQTAEMLNAFSEQSATGADLELRAADWDETRKGATYARGFIVVRDELLIKSALSADVGIGAVTLTLDATDDFPTAGFPYTVRIDEGTPIEEDLSANANNTGTDTLTLVAGTAYAHAIGARVAYVDGAGDRSIASGLSVRRAATVNVAAADYSTTRSGVTVTSRSSLGNWPRKRLVCR